MAALAEVLALVLEQQRFDRGVPGVAAQVFLDGEPACELVVGFAEVEAASPLRRGACFPVYSITKTFTAVCALRLAHAGVLDLDVPIARWLPALPFAREVSLRALLAHTAGVPDYSALPAYHAAVRAHPGEPWSFDEFVARTCTLPLDFPPGHGWRYSNTGYTLAKRILELAAEASFGELVAREVATPLALNETFALERVEDLRRVVPGYSRLLCEEGAAPADVRPHYHPGWCGTGVLASTGAETCAFFSALFEGRLVTPEALAEMCTLERVPGSFPPARTPCYGLGLMADPDSPLGAEFGHGGGGPGWNLRATHWPNVRGHALTLAVFCNHDAEDAWPIAVALAAAAELALA